MSFGREAPLTNQQPDSCGHVSMQVLEHDVELHGNKRGTGGLTNGTSLEQVIMYLLIKDRKNNLPKARR